MFNNISAKDCTSLDNVCYLLGGEEAQDDIGNWILGTGKTLTFCAELPAHSNEFFAAAKAGIRPEAVLLVDSESYNAESAVRYNDMPYTIYRYYPRPDGFTELYLKAATQ
ncbi:MAG: head-tail adaptor protein [Angelakisella sp.]